MYDKTLTPSSKFWHQPYIREHIAPDAGLKQYVQTENEHIILSANAEGSCCLTQKQR